MCNYVQLTPLTPEEKIFAEENHSALEWSMRVQRLDDDLYDVAAMGYLLAVKKWFARPELHKWSFKTIVRQTIRGKISNEARKHKCRIQTVSLDEVIPGTEDFTYAETITYDNLSYLGKVETGMKISYDVAIPEAARTGRQLNVEAELILDFLAGKKKNLCLEFDTKEEAAKRCSCIRSYRRNHKDISFELYKLDCKIFIEKPKKGANNG